MLSVEFSIFCQNIRRRSSTIYDKVILADSNTAAAERFLFSNMKMFDESYYSKQPEKKTQHFPFKKSYVFNAARLGITDRRMVCLLPFPL